MLYIPIPRILACWQVEQTYPPMADFYLDYLCEKIPNILETYSNSALSRWCHRRVCQEATALNPQWSARRRTCHMHQLLLLSVGQKEQNSRAYFVHWDGQDSLCFLICEWAPVSKTVALFITLLVKSEKLGGKKKSLAFWKLLYNSKSAHKNSVVQSLVLLWSLSCSMFPSSDSVKLLCGAWEQMLYVVLNWAKRMITDTCAVHIKQCLHAESQVQMEMANATHLILLSFGSDDVPPHALHSEARSQLHLCGPTARSHRIFHMEMSEQPQQLRSLLLYSHNHMHCWLICFSFKGVFCFGWTFLLFSVKYWYEPPEGSIVSTHVLCSASPSPFSCPPPPPSILTYGSINVKHCWFLVVLYFQVNCIADKCSILGYI